MPKATITYDLPDEQHEFDLATQAGKTRSAMWEYSQKLRAMIKYGELDPMIEKEIKESQLPDFEGENLSDEDRKFRLFFAGVERCRTLFYEALEEEGVELD